VTIEITALTATTSEEEIVIVFVVLRRSLAIPERTASAFERDDHD
jgi:hypothetical protein